MNLYQLASQDEAWGAYDDTTPWTARPTDPPAPVPPGPVPLDAALDAAAREYGVNADVLRALGPGGSVDSIFDTAASLRSRLEAFGGDYTQALASYRQAEGGQGGNIALAPPAAALSPPPLADAQMPAPGPAPEQAPSARPAAATPRPRPARPQAAARVPGATPPQAARPDQPPAPPDGRLGSADDPHSPVYRPAPAAQKPAVDAARSQPGSGADAASFIPVRPEVRQALGNAWDAASPGERQRMQSMPGWQGQLARERAAQYAQADKGALAASPTAALLDGRADNRAKAPPAASAAPHAGGNGRAQSQTAPRSTTPAGTAAPAPLTQRSWGEVFSDASKSAAQGILDLASLPGVAYGAVTGDYDTSYLNAIRGTQEVLQDEKSPVLQAQAQALQQKLATAEGWREKLAVGGWETLKNPTLLGDSLARSAPGMLAGGPLGRAAGGAADAAGNALLGRTIVTGSEAAARSAVALKNAAPAVASGTAVGAAAAQQGASVANDLYAELRKLPASAFAAEPEFQQLAREHGQDKARDILAAAATNRALLVGTGASVLSMKLLPGGDAIEKMFLPSHLKGSAAREAVKSSSFLTQPLTRGMQGNLGTKALEIALQGLKLGTTGSLSEGAEEASGAVAKGLELSRAGQDVKLSDMAGEAAGPAMAVGFAMDGAAGARRTNAARRAQDQPIQPAPPPASPPPPAPTMAHGQTTPAAPTASGPAVPPPPSPAATLAAALPPGYPQALQPDSVPTWSNTASATIKAQAEAEILRQAEALPAQETATAATDTPSPAASSELPAMPVQASTDSNHSGTQQGADASPQRQVGSDVGQAGTATQATAPDPADTPVPTVSVAGAQADANAATDTTPTTTQQGTARHTAASQIQPPAPAPIDAQIQALDSGMLVVGGNQTSILAHLQAGGVRGAEPFAGVTLVPVDQAALAQQVLSRPLAAQAGPVGPVGTQTDRGSQRASATAALPRARTAAQLAPTATQAPTTGGSTTSPSPVGASAPRSGGRHGSPASAAASQPAPVMEMQRDGTLMVQGDPAQLQERLRKGGVERVLRRKGGVLVGLDQVHKALQWTDGLQPAQPHNPAPSQGDFVAESYRSGYSDANGRAQEPTQPDDGFGPTQGDSRAAGDGALRRGGGAPLPRRTASLVGLGIAERIERSGSQSLLGEQVDSPQRLAELAQVYRDPRFETFRVFLVKDGVVVHATGVSSRMPGSTPMVPSGMSEQQYMNGLRDTMQRTGADSYYILHNHPSGNPTPSNEDVALTRFLAAHVPGLLAHVVINSNKYAVIDAANQGSAPAGMVRYQDFGEDRLLKASKPMAVLGEKIAGSDDFAIVGKSMQRPGWITLIGTGADNKVRAISEAPASILTRSYPYLAATVRRFMRQSGSGSVFAVGDAGDIGSKPVRDALAAGILRDALPDAGRTLHQQGVHTGGTGFSLTQGRRVAEGGPAPTSSSAADLETQRDGTLMVKGDPVQLQERLSKGGVDSVLRRKGGVLVGLDQVGKARQLLRQPPRASTSTSTSTVSPLPSQSSLPGQQFSRSAPDQASRARGLPSQPTTVQSVKAALAKLTNSMGLLAEGRGRVVVATSADIQAHWQPLVGKVDMGSQDTGLAHGFFDSNTDTVFLIADHIEAGQEMAVAAHELVHKHGKAVLGEAGWRQLHEVIGSWANKPEGSLERQVYDEAAARVQASRPDNADAAAYSSEELFPYAVQMAMELGVQPTALMPNNSVQGWLARVRAAMRGAWDRLTNKPELFDSQDLVDLAFAVAQRENPAQASEFEEPSTLAAPKPGITAQQARDIADKVLKGLGMRGTVTPTIMENPTAAGLVAPESMPSGGVSNGRLYLFLEGIRDEVEGFRVVFHELFHLGLSQSVTSQEYRQTMLHLLTDPLVRKYAARWKNSEDGQHRRGSMPVNNWHALAVEEALADMAEEIHHERGGVGTREMADWVRRTIAWMADLAHQWGMPKVARRLRGMTLTQAEAFVVDTVFKARTGAPVLLTDARWATSREDGRNSNLTQQLDEASQEPPTPRLDVSEKFKIKRYDGMTDIDYLDAENGIHGLNAYINRDGILSFEIRAQGDASILGSGTDMFSSLMKKINSESIFINGINGVWELGKDSVNAAEFLQNINAGMTREQAAMSTWTGRIASRYGYTVVLVPDQLGGVQFAYFRRPN